MLEALANVFEAQMIDLFDPKAPIELPGAVSSSTALQSVTEGNALGPFRIFSGRLFGTDLSSEDGPWKASAL
jgi:hypothetical protein